MVFKYVTTLKEKDILLFSLSQTKEQLSAVENEKQSLLQRLAKEKQLFTKLKEENSGIKATLITSRNELSRLEKAIDAMDSQAAALKAENSALNEEKAKLNTQLAGVTQERDSFKVKLSSVAELKKAIQELRTQAHNAGARIIEKIQLKKEKVVSGNRGFLIKDGRPTFAFFPRVVIEVNPPAQTENEEHAQRNYQK